MQLIIELNPECTTPIELTFSARIFHGSVYLMSAGCEDSIHLSYPFSKLLSDWMLVCDARLCINTSLCRKHSNSCRNWLMLPWPKPLTISTGTD